MAQQVSSPQGLFADLLEQEGATIDRSINDLWDVRLSNEITLDVL